jgi:dolichol kinase
MIISDTFASLVGKKYGRVNLSPAYTGSKRTLEGSIVFFITAFILCFSAFYFYGLINVNNQQELTLQLVFAYSVVTGLTGTLVELFSTSSYDDLTVPIATTMVIYTLASIT